MSGEIILVVDDNSNNVRLLRDILEDEQYTVYTADNGGPVLELAHLYQPSAILLDIMMPGLDGFEVCRMLKADSLAKDIPVLMVTAKTDSEDLKRALELGAFDFIRKPIDEIEVVARTQSALRFKEREDKLKEMASKDGLTGVYNRVLLVELFMKELAKLARSGKALSFVMLDIDFFKKVNDTYGHLAGDYILKELCVLLQSSLRSGDIIGRYGGEEFGIVMPETDADQACELCGRIRRLVEEHPFHTGSEEIRISVSSGISTVTKDLRKTVEELVKQADEALYCAKKNGRNRVELHS